MRSATSRSDAEVVLDHEHRGVERVAHLAEERAQRLGLALRDPGGGLVEQQHRRLVREHAREVDDAAGAGRQLVTEAVGVRAQAEPIDELVDPGAHRGLGTRHRREVERGARRDCGTRTARSHATAIVSRTVSAGNRRPSWNDRPRPSGARACGARPRRRRAPATPDPAGRDRARVGTHEARHDVEQRGLAGAVRPDHADDLAARDGERDAGERDDAAEAHADVAQLERGAGAVGAGDPRAVGRRTGPPRRRGTSARTRSGRSSRPARGAR